MSLLFASTYSHIIWCRMPLNSVTSFVIMHVYYSCRFGPASSLSSVLYYSCCINRLHIQLPIYAIRHKSQCCIMNIVTGKWRCWARRDRGRPVNPFTCDCIAAGRGVLRVHLAFTCSVLADQHSHL